MVSMYGKDIQSDIGDTLYDTSTSIFTEWMDSTDVGISEWACHTCAAAIGKGCKGQMAPFPTVMLVGILFINTVHSYHIGTTLDTITKHAHSRVLKLGKLL